MARIIFLWHDNQNWWGTAPLPLLPTPMTTIKFTCHEICTYNYDMWLLPNHDYYKHDTYNSYDVID